MDNIKQFIEKHLVKLVGSSGAIGAVQFVSQLQDYLSDGTLDNHEIISLAMSVFSAVQAVTLVALMAYLKVKNVNDQKGKDETPMQ
jgi:hypothetical protein